ncbi:nuclear transport factor 2 family protein [Parafrankia sp. EUN1f]|uniref:nuclear transport factor 2 family protein n=1 Tax=Parafrankia sp. EUN1f TaxID=102897 RepID=UPI0001C4624F|nr:nuclear transport factor 2 family protein [Parafrankia sp. EUN1f]EFC86366.1 aromatic ring hydroxylating dioxygenase beta subunit [Parafrankia sp. EUN1f]
MSEFAENMAAGIDVLAVQSVLARYCHRCDDGDFAGLVDLFTPDGVFTYGDRTAHGRSELLAFFQGTQGRPGQRGKHLTFNLDVRPDGDTARSVSDYVFLRTGADGPVLRLAGRYHDELRRLDGQWRIARRDVINLEVP